MGACVQPACLGGQHEGLHEHADIEKAHRVEVFVDGEDQPDRRIEEFIIAAPLRPVRGLIAFGNFQQRIHFLAQRPHPRCVRLLALRHARKLRRRVGRVRLAMGQHFGFQPRADFACHHMHFPRLNIGAGRRTAGERQQFFHERERYGIGFEHAHGFAGMEKLVELHRELRSGNFNARLVAGRGVVCKGPYALSRWE